MKSIYFRHGFAPGDLAAYRESAHRLDDLLRERSPVANRIIESLTREQIKTFEQIDFRITSEAAKVTFTILIADAAQRALDAFPECGCGKHAFCYRDQLAAVVPRLRRNAEHVLPVLHAKSARGGAGPPPEGPC